MILKVKIKLWRVFFAIQGMHFLQSFLMKAYIYVFRSNNTSICWKYSVYMDFKISIYLKEPVLSKFFITSLLFSAKSKQNIMHTHFRSSIFFNFLDTEIINNNSI